MGRAICVAISLACPSYRRRPASLRTARSPGVAFRFQPLRICRKPHQSRIKPSCAHTARRKSSGLDGCISQFFPFARFIMSPPLFVFSPWIDISQYHLVNRKPIDKTTESIIVFHLLHTSHKRTRVNLDAHQLDRAHDFTPAGIGLGCCSSVVSNSLLYTCIW